MYFLLFFFQADSLKKSLKGSSGNGGGGCSLDSKMQQVKELEEEVKNKKKYCRILSRFLVLTNLARVFEMLIFG